MGISGWYILPCPKPGYYNIECRFNGRTGASKEWIRFFDAYGTSKCDGPVLKQDEMPEVLPRPTPLSFSIMASLWNPGGSVDQACRTLGLKYNMPERDSGHLYQLFGKVYSDVAMKSRIALHLPKLIERTLEKGCGRVARNFYLRWMKNWPTGMLWILRSLVSNTNWSVLISLSVILLMRHMCPQKRPIFRPVF
ncbi:MAG: hypothetical protein JKX71_09355 [Amylibacter sp.]|nr:hypothetical protein [Amylibacter sp.]